MLQQWAGYIQSLVTDNKVIVGRFAGRAS